MEYKNIAKVVVGLPLDGPFDYRIPAPLKGKIVKGMRVEILFAHRQCVGYVIDLADKSHFKGRPLNFILAILDKIPALDDQALQLTKLVSEYYGCSWGEAIETYLPAVLRTKKVFSGQWPVVSGQKKQQSLLSTDHPAVLKIEEGGTPPTIIKEWRGRPLSTLITDPTYEQRWPIIIERIQKTLEKRQSIIFLVPENFRIAEVISKLKEAVTCELITLEKKLAASKELEQWVRMRTPHPMVVLGTRSAIFAPLQDLGLIIVDQEDHGSYKQEQTPHYHAGKIACMRRQLEGCNLIFTSVAPSVETWVLAKKEKWERMDFFQDVPRAQMQIIDMTNYNPQRSSILSFPLQNEIHLRLQPQVNNSLREKVSPKILLFMNRRGFSTFTRCQHCGFVLKCERCEISLTYLYAQKLLVCRYCGFKEELPKICPKCRGRYLRSTGVGIEKLESELARLYPGSHITRLDKETEHFHKEADMIVATQAVFRYRQDIQPLVSVVLDLDAELNRFDLRVAHRVFSLLIELSCWAKDKLIVQTRFADNPYLRMAQKFDYALFYKEEEELRKQLGFPPFRHWVTFHLRGAKKEVVQEISQNLYTELHNNLPSKMEVAEPIVEGIVKLRDQYRYMIHLKGPSVKGILNHVLPILRQFRRRKAVIVTVDVDP